MPSLQDLLDFVVCCCNESGGDGTFSDGFMLQVEKQIRQTWGGERVYISPPESRKDPRRAEAIRKAARFLPTRVVAERFGVSRSAIYRITRRK